MIPRVDEMISVYSPGRIAAAILRCGDVFYVSPQDEFLEVTLRKIADGKTHAFPTLTAALVAEKMGYGR